METVRNPEGIGSIGRLLARSRRDTTGPYAINGNSFYHADGNGNVMYLASSSGGTDAAYRYDPFGRWLAQTGPYASANVMRFSSKPWVAHNGSNTDGLYYYGYRFYDPLTQRWLNKDPFGEAGFETLRRNRPSLLGDSANLYLFVFNNPNSWIDLYGLAADSITAAIEACMRQPTPAARLSCLEELFGDVCFNPRNTDVIKNALREARNEAGKEAFKGKSSLSIEF
jgi:RHS repeat-associated protein